MKVLMKLNAKKLSWRADMNFQDQEKRRVEKEQVILDFLREAGFSTAKILGDLLDLRRTATFETLKSLKRRELLQEVKTTDEVGSGSPSLWGLTPTGAFLATEEGDWSYFDPNRVSPITIKHELAVQMARVKTVGMEWGEWLGGRTLRKMAHKERSKWLQVPDAFAISPKGRKVALEVERTVKTSKRYEAIFSSYCQMLLDDTVQEIVYICPEDIAPRLERFFSKIDSMRVNGSFRPVNDSFRKRFHFVTYEGWGDYAIDL